MRRACDFKGPAGNFGERLLYIKKVDNISWTELSQKTGVSINSLVQYAGHGRNPTLYAAVAIAKALDVSLDWLCGLED